MRRKVEGLKLLYPFFGQFVGVRNCLFVNVGVQGCCQLAGARVVQQLADEGVCMKHCGSGDGGQVD